MLRVWVGIGTAGNFLRGATTAAIDVGLVKKSVNLTRQDRFVRRPATQGAIWKSQLLESSQRGWLPLNRDQNLRRFRSDRSQLRVATTRDRATSARRSSDSTLFVFGAFALIDHSATREPIKDEHARTILQPVVRPLDDHFD